MFAGSLRFVITAAALPLCAQYLPGVVMLDLHKTLVLGALLALAYTILRPLVRLILSVINFCTLGLLYVAVDAWIVWTAAQLVEGSVQFESFWWALAVAVLLNAARMAVDVLAGDAKR